jgi:hypothetical protein
MGHTSAPVASHEVAGAFVVYPDSAIAIAQTPREDRSALERDAEQVGRQAEDVHLAATTTSGAMITHCSFCALPEVTVGTLIRGRDGAICRRCLPIALDVAGEKWAYAAKPQYRRRLTEKQRWQANTRWKARGLPEL